MMDLGKRKKVAFALFLCLLSLCTACGNKQEEHDRLTLLTEIERLGDQSPASALELLENMKAKYATAPQDIQMAYRLLRVRLQDKADVLPQSEDEMREICDFYAKNGNPQEKMQAYYYMGSVARDLHDSPQAVTCFLKAAEVAESTPDIDSTMLANTYSQLSALWRRQLRDEESAEAAEKAYKTAEAAGIMDPIYAMDVVTSRNLMSDTAGVLSYADKVLAMLEAEGPQNTAYADVVTELMYIYSAYGRSPEADKCHSMLGGLSGTLPHNYWLVSGKYYEQADKTDSAVQCYLHDMERPRVSEREESARALTYIYGNRGMFRDAYRYALLWGEANDSTDAEFRRAQATNAANEYMYFRDIERENDAFRTSARDRQRLYVMVAVTLVLLIISRLLYVRIQRKMTRSAGKIREERKSMKMQYARQKQELENLQNLIFAQKEEMEEREGKILALEKELREKRKLLEDTKEEYRRLYADGIVQSPEGMDGSIKEKIDRACQSRYKLSEGEWNAFFSSVDAAFPVFFMQLENALDNFTPNRKKVAYLMKMGKKPLEIENATGLNRSTVWRRMNELSDIIGASE